MNLERLVNENYTVLNGKIVDIITELKDENTLNFSLLIQGDNWQCLYGNFNLFDENYLFRQSIYGLLTALEETNIFNLKNKTVRVAVQNTSTPVEYIGNIILDIWYNFNDYKVIEEKVKEEDINVDNNESEENTEEETEV